MYSLNYQFNLSNGYVFTAAFVELPIPFVQLLRSLWRDIKVFEYDLWLRIQALVNVGIADLNFDQGLLNNLMFFSFTISFLSKSLSMCLQIQALGNVGISHFNFNQGLLNNLMFFSFRFTKQFNLVFFSFTIYFLSCWTLHDLITPH